jgi:hypothetical protein
MFEISTSGNIRIYLPINRKMCGRAVEGRVAENKING